MQHGNFTTLQTHVSTFKHEILKIINNNNSQFFYNVVDVALIIFIDMLVCKSFVIKLIVV